MVLLGSSLSRFMDRARDLYESLTDHRYITQLVDHLRVALRVNATGQHTGAFITTCDSCHHPKCSRARLLFGRISRAHHSEIPAWARTVFVSTCNSDYTSWTGSEKSHAHVNEHKAKDEALDKGRLRTEASRLRGVRVPRRRLTSDRIETRPLT